jgi:hypothetical protein
MEAKRMDIFFAAMDRMLLSPTRRDDESLRWAMELYHAIRYAEWKSGRTLTWA